MPDSLITRMQHLSDRLNRLPDSFGLPSVTNVVLIKEGTFTALTPKPQKEQVNPQRVGGFLSNSVEVMADDIWLLGVSRQYSYDLLISSIWLLDAVSSGANNWTGRRCKCLDIRTDNPLTYTVLVRDYEDR